VVIIAGQGLSTVAVIGFPRKLFVILNGALKLPMSLLESPLVHTKTLLSSKEFSVK
jgi:hypothetical protein